MKDAIFKTGNDHQDKKIHVAKIAFINSALLNLVIDDLSADIAESLAENYSQQLISKS